MFSAFKQKYRRSGRRPATLKTQSQIRWTARVKRYYEADMEKISIVIVTVGADQTLVECLASLRRHTHSAHEIILVNNGCDSLDIVGAADLKIIENGRNLGFARAVNRGIAAADGDMLLLLNPDTILKHDAIGAMRAFMDANPAAGICGVQLTYADDRLQNSVDIIPGLATQFLNKSLLKIMFPKAYPSKRSGFSEPVKVPSVIGACMLIRKTLIERIGGLDEGFFFYLEETDFCKRAAECGFEVWHLPQIRVVHQGLSAKKIDVRRKVEFNRSMWRFFRKHHGRLITAIFYILTVIKLLFETAGNLLLGFIPRMRPKLKKSAVLLAWYLCGMPRTWGIEGPQPAYETRRIEGYTWFVRTGSTIPDAMHAPNRFLDEFSTRVLNRSRTTYIKSGELDGRTIFFKRYNFKGVKDSVKNIFRPSRARHCFEAALLLEKMGIDTPEAFAACERRTGRILNESFIATRGITATDLVQLVDTRGCDRQTVITLARFIRKIHDMGILHVDLKGENLMLDEQGRIFLIDLDRLNIKTFLSMEARAKNLCYLNASFVNSVPEDLRRLFLDEYVKGDPRLEKQRPEMARRISRLTARRLEKRY